MAVTFTDTEVSRSGIAAVTINPDHIKSGWNSRHALSDKWVEELSHLIASSPMGQETPGKVRKGEGGYAYLIEGNCRLAAIRLINENLDYYRTLYPDLQGPLGFKAVYVACNEDEAIELNLSENLNRLNLSPIDKADTIRKLEKRGGWDDSRIARALRCSVGYLSVLRGYLSLPQEAQDSMHRAYVDGERGITGELGTALQGLPEEEIKKTVAQVESGEVKPADAVRKVKAQKRERGVRASMTLKEFRDLLKKHEKTEICFDLLCIISGESTMTFSQWVELYNLEADERENGHQKAGAGEGEGK